MEDQNASSQEQEGLAGEAGDVAEDSSVLDANTSDENESQDDPNSSKKRPTGWERLKQKNRAYERDIREMQAKMAEMQSVMYSQQQQSTPNQQMNDQSGGNDVNDQIHKAVSFALNHKEEMERKQREAERLRQMNQKYVELQKHLDKTSDKYEDFDEVVRGDDAPFTNSMRDAAALFLPKSGPASAGEVLYKLGKDRDALIKIKHLPPEEQIEAMIKMSIHLANVHTEKRGDYSRNELGNIRSNPALNSLGVTDKTPVSELRRRIKEGWK